MGLLNLIKEDESLKFISLKEAINLLAEKTNSNIYEVSAYLLNKNVPGQLDSYARQNNYKIEATSSSIDETHWCGENHCFFWLEYVAKDQKHYPSFRVANNNKYSRGCEENYWIRADFLNLDCIKELNVFGTEDANLDKRQQYIWDTHYLNILKDDIPDLEIAKDELFIYSFMDQPHEYEQIPYHDENNTKQLDNLLPSHIKILAMNDYFTVVESACFISFDEPEKMQAYIDSGDLIYDAWRYGEHIQAVKVIEGGLKAQKLDMDNDGMISRTSLQQFLFDRNHVIAGFNDNLSQQNQSTFGIPKLQQTEPNIENQNAEIARLRGELAAAQERIKQLESEPLIERVEENNLLALIFDESATDRYAPDLVLSIKLWEHIYITNPKSDSHTNKAIKWLENNTCYEVNKKAGSASKIREITTPFVSWGNLRDKNYKK